MNVDGTFLFHLAKTAGDPTAAVAGLMNMPLPQPVNPGKGPGDFYIQYPLKPGLTVMMVAYDSDYVSSKLDLADSVAYPIDSVELLVSPSNLSVDSPLFKAAGADAETGSQKYLAENVPPNAQLAASVSGEAAAGETAAGGPPASQSDAEVKTLPNSMTRMGGLLLACFLLVLLWGLGVRVAKEWPKWKAQQSASELQKALEAEVEKLFNSLADLDELFADRQDCGEALLERAPGIESALGGDTRRKLRPRCSSPMPSDTPRARPALELRDVSKQFGDLSGFEGVCLRVEPGDSILLYGPERRGQNHAAARALHAGPSERGQGFV